MLVFTRHRGQGITVGDVHITIEDVRGDKVRVGIVAPPEIRVDRDEVAAKRQEAECSENPA